MDKITFKPSFFSLGRIFILGSLLIVTIIFGFWILPKALNLYKEFPSPETLQVVLMVAGGLLAYWLASGFIVIAQFTSSKISIEDKLLYFYYKPILGKSQNQIINLEQVELVGYRQQVIPVFTGKSIIPVVRRWLVFNHKDGRKEEVFINDWDNGTLKNIIFYIKGKFPHIKFNTPFYKDSSEVLVGLEEFSKI